MGLARPVASITEGWPSMSLRFHDSTRVTCLLQATAIALSLMTGMRSPASAQTSSRHANDAVATESSEFVRAPVHVAAVPEPVRKRETQSESLKSHHETPDEPQKVLPRSLEQTSYQESVVAPSNAAMSAGGSPWVTLPTQGMMSQTAPPPHLILRSPGYQRHRDRESWWSSHHRAAPAATIDPHHAGPTPPVETRAVIPTQHIDDHEPDGAPETGLGAALFPDQSAIPAWPPGVDNDPGNVGPGQLGLGQHWIKSPIKRRPVIPAATTQPIWKTPYSYGHFGPTDARHWYRHHGYRDRYLQWTLR
ncbi:MAG: hypothetical protein AAGD07_09575 [Planctomycetota bacterium]